MWIFFSFLSALMQANFQAITKFLAGNLPARIIGVGHFLIALPAMIIYLLFKGIPILNDSFFLALFITSSINIIAMFFLVKGLLWVDLSLGSPVLALTPLFAFITSRIIVGENVNWLGFIGVIISIAGIILANWEFKKVETRARHVKHKLGLLYLLIVAFLYSFSANYDKLASINSNPLFSGIFSMFLIGLVFVLISCFKQDKKYFTRQNIKKILLLGLFVFFGYWFWASALFYGKVIYAMSIKRFSIVIASFYGFIFFKEKNIAQKLLGAFTTLLGIFLIIFFG